jgi:HupE / UreJ protein
MSSSLTRLLKIVTAFTVAHSLTLALAATGLVTPPGDYIEPAIALTIAYVGFVSLRRKGADHGLLLAFAFGLVHGFGFAGALAETLADRGTPIGGHWLVNLASFNLGIEFFQVLLVLIVVPLVRIAERASWSVPAHRLASVAVLTAGLAWFAGRTWTWVA